MSSPADMVPEGSTLHDRSPVHHEGEEPPPPGVGVMAWVRWLILLLMLVGAVASFWVLLAPPAGGTVKYTCPMVEHAFVILDEPGECPICHMQLIPMDASLAEARRQQEAAEGDGGSPVPGAMPVALHLDRVQKIGVRTALVTESDVEGGLRAPAYVEAPEQGRSQVHVRTAGFVESIAVAQTGVAVGKGQPLFRMYSPEIYRAEEELLASRRFARDDAGPLLDSGPTIEAGRRRLELLGLRREDVDDLLKRDAPERTVAVRAPASGYVVRKEATLGAYVTPEMTLYEIVDLSRVYVVADVFTRDAALVRPGMKARVRFAQSASPEVEAKVELVYPEMNPQARTTRVRLEVSNKKHALRPGMYGEAVFDARPRRTLGVPRDAVVDTGTTQYVFVDEGEGRFSPRKVVLGAESPERVEILDGLRPGERVVSGATFLIDSESRLQAAIAGLAEPPASPSSSASSGASAPPAPSASPPSALVQRPPPPRAAAPGQRADGPAPSGTSSPPAPSPSAPQAPSPAPPSAARPPADPPAVYSCPMHPEVQSPAPGACPKCGMDLVKKP